MLKYIFVFVFVFMTTSAMADGAGNVQAFNEKLNKDIVKYEADAKACDINFSKEAEAADTTTAMKQSAYNAKDCYQNIINNIIDTYYSKNAEKQKEALTNFIKASYDIYGDMQMTPDYCLPACGTMFSVIYATNVATLLENLTYDYIRRLELLAD